MDSELASCSRLLEDLLLLDLLTRDSSESSEQIGVDSSERSTSGNVFEESADRMIKYASQVGNGGGEYSFCIRNLYDTLKKESLKTSESIATFIDTADDFHLTKAVITVSNKRNDSFDEEQIISIKNNFMNVKRRRCILSRTTREFLQKAFEAQPFPNRKDRELIAKKCGISNLQVRVWFTNRRMRSKRRN
ncbi:uncharacterized protein RJT21DRAFT_16031 [Scheffersomyces amazonensis]|uniref:uncharacterized protein n=1 Tax=Scheffersomyces amazonensis TaxID=1078765 RepID=UPI00315DB5E5